MLRGLESEEAPVPAGSGNSGNVNLEGWSIPWLCDYNRANPGQSWNEKAGLGMGKGVVPPAASMEE